MVLPFFVFFTFVIFILLALLVYNKTKNEFVLLALAVIFPFLAVTALKDILIFVFGLFFGYFSDFIGVKRGYWEYPTKSKYSIWVGAMWAVTILSIYKMIALPFFFLILLALVTLIVGYLFDNVKFITIPSALKFSLVILLTQRYADILVVSFFIGMLIEITGVYVFPSWKYKMTQSYIVAGITYAALSYLIFTVIDFFLYNHPFRVIEILVAILYAVNYVFFPKSDNLRRQPKVTKKIIKLLNWFKKKYKIREATFMKS